MMIKIMKQLDVYLTATEVARYWERYQHEFMYYCGPRPDFVEWVAQQERDKSEHGR